MKKTLGALLLSVTAISPFYRIGHAQMLLPGIHRVDQDWYELSPRERSRARENYERYRKLSPEKQRAIEERYNRWRGLPPDEQNRIRENYRRYRGMGDDEQEEFRRKYKRWRRDHSHD